jgi:hypothetical protein
MPSSSPSRAAAANPDRVGIFLDVLDNIIADLNEDPELQRIFGVPVSRALAIVADQNDLRIEDGGRVALTAEQQAQFLGVLDRVIRQNSV